ncbi:MAG TPA: BTAD domain-containing putative transcriptional regulator [Chloroflexota bacterium]|nr:BTAD domain-containing putative transcriptional regulator [Chloroflexota bacterium]
MPDSASSLGASVLIVDDDSDIRSVLAEFLKDEGYAPREAVDGREAIACLESPEGTPDLMLLDLMMPEVDGYEVLAHMRRTLRQDVPVLIFSAQRPGPAVLEALDAESRDFIAKPFEFEELLIRMQRLLHRSPRFAAAETDVLRVYVLGSLRLYRKDSLLFDESWRNKPAKTIFKMLFTTPGKRYPKDVLAEALWPETEPDVAANRLRVAVHDLRKMLGEGGRQAKRYIAQQEGAYYFDDRLPVWSDVAAFAEAVRRGRELAREDRRDDALQAYGEAEALYQGEYLRDDPFFDWTISTRERLREQHLAMLSDAARLHAADGQFEEAAGFCRKIVRIEPWREEVYRRLMQYLMEAGRPHEALRVYEECRRALQAEVGAEPSPETAGLRDLIANGKR